MSNISALDRPFWICIWRSCSFYTICKYMSTTCRLTSTDLHIYNKFVFLTIYSRQGQAYHFFYQKQTVKSSFIDIIHFYTFHNKIFRNIETIETYWTKMERSNSYSNHNRFNYVIMITKCNFYGVLWKIINPLWRKYIFLIQ